MPRSKFSIDPSLLNLGKICQVLWRDFKSQVDLINVRYFKMPLIRKENKLCFQFRFFFIILHRNVYWEKKVWQKYHWS